MAYYSRKHLAEAQARGGFRELPALAADDYEWPEGTSPETAEWAGVDAQMAAIDALHLALASERRGHAYYAAIAATTNDRELRGIAGEFADEEAQHVAELEKLIAARTTA
jgi:rubrerythrin